MPPTSATLSISCRHLAESSIREWAAAGCSALPSGFGGRGTRRPSLPRKGGNPAGCGTFPNANLFFLYVTVVPPGAPLSGGANFLTVQHDTVGPTTSTMNYYPGINIANFAITAASTVGSNGGFNAYASNDTHVVIDLLAWGGTLGLVPLQQANQTATVDVTTGSFGQVCTAACPAGLTLTGGGCDWGSAGGLQKNIEETGPSRAPGQNGWCCGGSQSSGVTRTLNAIAFCSRVPSL
jgi:hypothetical protein